MLTKDERAKLLDLIDKVLATARQMNPEFGNAAAAAYAKRKLLDYIQRELS